MFSICAVFACVFFFSFNSAMSLPIDINACASSPCQNGGQCRDMVNRFTCENCNAGYEGTRCERGTYVHTVGVCQPCANR